MEWTPHQTLRLIGEQLDGNVFPVIGVGGIVRPTKPLGRSGHFNKAYDYEKQRSRRPSTKSGQGPTRGQRTTSTTTSVLCNSLGEKYGAQQTKIELAYPGAQFIWLSDGFWLRTESHLTPECTCSAVIVSYIPFSNCPPRSWAFWSNGEWIGPRHTNFPDGSICSFEPSDLTWRTGDSVVALLDLHTLWVARQLHLREFGWWPGSQCVRHAHERLTELKPSELCGCDNFDLKKYVHCCMKSDLRRDRVQLAINFMLTHNGGRRHPPSSVRRLYQVFKAPPQPDSGGSFP